MINKIVVASCILILSVAVFAADEPKQSAPVTAPVAVKCKSGDLLGMNPDGKVCWGSDYDSVAKVAMKRIADDNAEKQKMVIQYELLLNEVTRLRQVCPGK